MRRKNFNPVFMLAILFTMLLFSFSKAEETSCGHWRIGIGLTDFHIKNSYFSISDFRTSFGDIGYTSSKITPTLKLRYKFKRSYIGLDYMGFSLDGFAHRTDKITVPYSSGDYNSIVINGDYTIDSSIKFTSISGFYAYNLIKRSENNPLKLRASVGVDYIIFKFSGNVRGKFDITYYKPDGSSTTSSGLTSYDIPEYKLDASIPFIGLNLRYKFSDSLMALADIRWMSAKVSDSYGKYYKLDIGVRYKSPQALRVKLGYSILKLYYEDDEDRTGELKIYGPTLDIGYKF